MIVSTENPRHAWLRYGCIRGWLKAVGCCPFNDPTTILFFRNASVGSFINLVPKAGSMKSLMRRLVDELAERPAVFDFLRWVLEAGYCGEKYVIRREQLSAAVRVLDLGCGTGALARNFCAESYVGVDANPRYIERAVKTKPGYTFAVMDARSLKFPSFSFDAVLISGVIHHLDDDDALAILREAQRVLKLKTGRFVMWEDIPMRRPWNLIGRVVHALDAGKHIRLAERYEDLAHSVFGHHERSFMSSGVCDYVVITARNGC